MSVQGAAGSPSISERKTPISPSFTREGRNLGIRWKKGFYFHFSDSDEKTSSKNQWNTDFRAFMKDVVLDIIHDGWEKRESSRNDSLWTGKGPYLRKYPDYAPFEEPRYPIPLGTTSSLAKGEKQDSQVVIFTGSPQCTEDKGFIYNGPLLHNTTSPLTTCNNKDHEGRWGYVVEDFRGFKAKPIKIWDDGTVKLSRHYKDTQRFITDCSLTPTTAEKNFCDWITKQNNVPDISSLVNRNENLHKFADLVEGGTQLAGGLPPGTIVKAKWNGKGKDQGKFFIAKISNYTSDGTYNVRFVASNVLQRGTQLADIFIVVGIDENYCNIDVTSKQYNPKGLPTISTTSESSEGAAGAAGVAGVPQVSNLCDELNDFLNSKNTPDSTGPNCGDYQCDWSKYLTKISSAHQFKPNIHRNKVKEIFLRLFYPSPTATQYIRYIFDAHDAGDCLWDALSEIVTETTARKGFFDSQIEILDTIASQYDAIDKLFLPLINKLNKACGREKVNVLLNGTISKKPTRYTIYQPSRDGLLHQDIFLDWWLFPAKNQHGKDVIVPYITTLFGIKIATPSFGSTGLALADDAKFNQHDERKVDDIFGFFSRDPMFADIVDLLKYFVGQIVDSPDRGQSTKWSIRNVSSRMAKLYDEIEKDVGNEKVFESKIDPFRIELEIKVGQRLPWKKVLTLILQIYKTLGDLGVIVEFADTQVTTSLNVRRTDSLRLPSDWNLERKNRLFVSKDIIAINFARKLAAGSYREWIRDVSKSVIKTSLARTLSEFAPAYLIYQTRQPATDVVGSIVYTSPLIEGGSGEIRKPFRQPDFQFGSKWKKKKILENTKEYLRFLAKYSLPAMLLPGGFVGVSAAYFGKKYLMNAKPVRRKSTFGAVPRRARPARVRRKRKKTKRKRKKSSYGTKRKKTKRKRKKSSYGTKRKKAKRKAKKKTIPLKDARIRVAKRKWLKGYSGKVYKLTTLANHFGVSLRQGRGWKQASRSSKSFGEKNEKKIVGIRSRRKKWSAGPANQGDAEYRTPPPKPKPVKETRRRAVKKKRALRDHSKLPFLEGSRLQTALIRALSGLELTPLQERRRQQRRPTPTPPPRPRHGELRRISGGEWRQIGGGKWRRHGEQRLIGELRHGGSRLIGERRHGELQRISGGTQVKMTKGFDPIPKGGRGKYAYYYSGEPSKQKESSKHRFGTVNITAGGEFTNLALMKDLCLDIFHDYTNKFGKANRAELNNFYRDARPFYICRGNGPPQVPLLQGCWTTAPGAVPPPDPFNPWTTRYFQKTSTFNTDCLLGGDYAQTPGADAIATNLTDALSLTRNNACLCLTANTVHYDPFSGNCCPWCNGDNARC